MGAVRITSDNVHTIMLNAGIDESMLMKEANKGHCSMSRYSCRDACDKYGLSGDECLVGKRRAGACVLYRLYNIINDNSDCSELYSPEHLAVCQQVGEL